MRLRGKASVSFVGWSACMIMTLSALTASGAPSRMTHGVSTGVSTGISAGISAPIELHPRARSNRDTLPEALATITTDTGAFAPGERDFSRYEIPGLCRSAALRALMAVRADSAAQLYVYTLGPLDDDTSGIAAARATAHACGARFRVQSTAVRDLPDLFDVAVYTANDSLAAAALDQMIAHAPSADTRAIYYVNALDTLLQFQRFAAARALMASIDAKGPAGSPEQLAAHGRYLRYLSSHADSSTQREIAHLLTLAKQTPDSNYYVFKHCVVAYNNLMLRATESAQDSVAMFDLAKQAKRVLAHFNKESDQVRSAFEHYIDWGRLPLDSVILELAPPWYTMFVVSDTMHTPLAPRLQADTWFPAPGHSAADTIFPVPGKVNLLCLGEEPVTDGWGMPLGYGTIHERGYNSAAGFAIRIRHLLSTYADRGVVLTMVRPIHGRDVYDSTGAPKAGVFHDVKDHAKTWQWYYQDYEQLPAAVAVQIQQRSWLPDRDGRAWHDAAPQYQQYIDLVTPLYTRGARQQPFPGRCTVVGRDGTIVYSDHEYGRGALELFMKRFMRDSSMPSIRASAHQ